jgi:alpha-mannosidase
VYLEARKYREPLVGEDPLYLLQGSEPDTGRGLTVHPENVAVSAFFEEQGVAILRLYEHEGAETVTRIALPFTISGVAVTDLLGRPLGGHPELAAGDAAVVITLRPWEILTLRMRRA